jgi:hypothetical protein
VRKAITVLSVVIALVMLAPPAGATPPVTRSKMTTAESFWHFDQPTGPNSFTETTWYVGVFVSTDGGAFLYSDLYQDVESCTTDQAGNVSCTQVSSKYGDSNLSGPTDAFTMDFTNLSTASLDGTYQLQSYDQNGNPVGSPETDRIVATWTGTGPIIKSHSKFSFHQRCIHFQATDKGKTRAASASGTLKGSSLGSTTDTFFGGDATIQVDHNC